MANTRLVFASQSEWNSERRAIEEQLLTVVGITALVVPVFVIGTVSVKLRTHNKTDAVGVVVLVVPVTNMLMI